MLLIPTKPIKKRLIINGTTPGKYKSKTPRNGGFQNFMFKVEHDASLFVYKNGKKIAQQQYTQTDIIALYNNLHGFS
jgi:hypothetical protein